MKMKASSIQLALLVASVAASPTPDASPDAATDAIPGLQFEVRDLETRDASGLHERSQLSKRNGWLYCGMMANGSGNNLRSLYDDFGGETYTAPAHGCIRAKCWNTSGVYVCNDKATALTVSGTEIKKHLINILEKCCMWNTDGTQNYGYYTNGQQFTDALGGFNVVAGYADCKEDKYVKPTNEGGAGVNGKTCLKYQQYIG
ncbi:hypothetical protein N0V93_008454 [Gnomoniopsis smithogilvyi]|uniref:Uncharacterized protein n=1 Tax=Gnomoniopsis smithogilvyi TaxID=1191159 RepID=A0A9W8YMR5_9PEZI|nr:hypothetical protein N0V93_008454 [Gnomoniopsis smithogilvyi]